MTKFYLMYKTDAFVREAFFVVNFYLLLKSARVLRAKLHNLLERIFVKKVHQNKAEKMIKCDSPLRFEIFNVIIL